MNNNILFVDDDIHLLSSMKRNLHNKFNITTASSGKEGLKEIVQNQRFAVIISDMRMPEMDGVEFLTIARNKSPNSVRMMLTGNADLTTAVNAVNAGNEKGGIRPVSFGYPPARNGRISALGSNS